MKVGGKMSKVKVHITLTTPEDTYQYETLAIWQEQEEMIVYQEPTQEKAKVKFDFRKNELHRETNSVRMFYPFDIKKLTTGTIFVKELNQQLSVKLRTTKLIRNLNNISIKYQMEEESYQYKIEVI